MRDARLYELACSPWVIEPIKGGHLLAVLEAHARGIERATTHGARAESEARAAARAASQPAPASIAVIPIHGVLMPRGDFITDGSGSTSVEGLRGLFRSALDASSIAGIVLDIDSPGGSVFGVEEFADEIRAARKPVVAQAWDFAASGAYWIAAAASELVVTPSGMVGSIGVYSLHYDASAWYEKQGVKPTIIEAGKFKTEMADTKPLSDDAKEYEQGIVDAYYQKFVRAVAKGRKTDIETVRGTFGEGRVLTANDALKVGMVDRIGTLDDTIRALARKLEQKQRAARASEGLRQRRSRVEKAL